MAVSVNSAWRHRRIGLGLILIGVLATVAGSYVARSAISLVGTAGYLISMVLWAPIGCMLSALAYQIYLDYEKED